MSPRFTSATTSRPASRAYVHTCSNVRTPSAPYSSKKADWGFTATACSATASTIPRQNAPTSPPTAAGSFSATGSSPTTSWLRLRSTASASRSPNTSAVLDGRLQCAAGRELRDACRRDRDLLLRVARVHAGARRAHLRVELAEAGQRDVAACTERVGDHLHRGVHRLPGVARRQLAAPRHLGHELLLGHVTLLLSVRADPN